MRLVPDTISANWIGTLTDADLIDVEARLHTRFSTIESREKRTLGGRYDFFRGSADLMDAWDRWSRVHTATRARKLHPRRGQRASAAEVANETEA